MTDLLELLPKRKSRQTTKKEKEKKLGNIYGIEINPKPKRKVSNNLQRKVSSNLKESYSNGSMINKNAGAMNTTMKSRIKQVN